MKRPFLLKINSWILIAMLLPAGAAGTYAVYRSVSYWREKTIEGNFRTIAGNRIALLQNRINTELTILWSLKSYFDATPDISREKFKIFTQQLLRLYPEVDSYHWIPRVRDAERKDFESAVGKEMNLPGFKISEMSSGRGSLIPARHSAEYFPSLFLEPYKKNALSLGFDQMSVKERRRSMARAAVSKTMIATRIHPMWHPQPDGKDAYFFVYLPVFEAGAPSQTKEQRKDNLKGFVAAGFRVDRLIQATFTTLDMSELNLGFYAETVDRQHADIYQYERYKPVQEEPAFSSYSYSETLAVADQRWLLVAKSTPLFSTHVGSLELKLIPVAGLLITLLVCSFLILWEEWKRGDFFLRMSLKDELTGLYNRRGFLTLAAAHLKLIRRKKIKSLMLFADLDGLKEINDNFGHEEGDKALAAAGEILRSSFRGSDIVARTGGDEFAVLAFDVNDKGEAAVLRHLRNNIDRYNDVERHSYQVLLSIGSIAINPEDEISVEKILSDADKEMYFNKRNHNHKIHMKEEAST